MTKEERARFIMEKLDEFFPQAPLPLLHRDPFTLLIAVLLSAQCTDKRVNEVTPALFRLAGTPEKMRRIPLKKLEELIRPCGLFRNKAKSILALSEALVSKHGGAVPATFAELEALPGVGHKTASVVLVQAFGKEAFPVDTHIHRLAWRWRLSNGKSVLRTEEECKRYFPAEKWHKIHLQLIYFGRKYCPARGHRPETCPICSVIGRKKMFS